MVGVHTGMVNGNLFIWSGNSFIQTKMSLYDHKCYKISLIRRVCTFCENK